MGVHDRIRFADPARLSLRPLLTAAHTPGHSHTAVTCFNARPFCPMSSLPTTHSASVFQMFVDGNPKVASDERHHTCKISRLHRKRANRTPSLSMFPQKQKQGHSVVGAPQCSDPALVPHWPRHSSTLGRGPREVDLVLHRYSSVMHHSACLLGCPRC